MKREAIDRLEREDLVLFINACFACTGQWDYYTDARGGAVGLDFLHAYILGNYRALYARTLAAGINHFNRAAVAARLLDAGAPESREDRAREASLLRATLQTLPTGRVYRLLETLGAWGVNNRRARAVVASWVASREDLPREAVLYRPRLRAILDHFHPPVPPEVARFVREGGRRREPYENPLFEAYRRARTDPSALYELPFSVAEGFAARHKVPRDVFLQGIDPMLTPVERLRLQRAAEEASVDLSVDLSTLPLGRLVRYALGPGRTLSDETLEDALQASVARALRRAPLALGRCAAVLDRSHSSGGAASAARHALAVAVGVSRLARAAATEYRAFWTPAAPEGTSELRLSPAGLTDLATPLLDALAWRPDTVLVVSDGYENHPPGGVDAVVGVLRAQRGDLARTSVVHLNPAFDGERLMPRTVSPRVPTVGLREPEDLATVLGFARFAEGTGTLRELEGYLDARVQRFLARAEGQRGAPR
ncbi:MAG: hypothetical protein HY909_28810 [Deltaproteobacteria bacterium]|nr:hypothetical protein [Deltaproteobacteria bacterium]